jgi:hypothetical protein
LLGLELEEEFCVLEESLEAMHYMMNFMPYLLIDVSNKIKCGCDSSL